MTSLILYAGNSQFVEASGLKDQSRVGTPYVNDAILTATLTDAVGNPVGGASNMAGVYQTGSNGVYRFALSVPFNPAPGLYTLVIDGTGDSATFHAEIITLVKVRTKGTEQ